MLVLVPLKSKVCEVYRRCGLALDRRKLYLLHLFNQQERIYKMKRTINILGAAVLASTILAGMTAQAQDGAALFMSKACIACHGVEGKQPINDNTPKLAGQNKGYLMTQIKDIKSGARNNGITAQMKPIVANLSDQDIEAIAEYLSLL